MKTVVICNPYIKNVLPESIISEYILYGEKLAVGLADIPEIEHRKYMTAHSVLVCVRAFSCNYRDKTLMLMFNQMCRNISGKGKYFFSPFGSEFVAEVVEVGEAVTSFKKRDRVIPDCTYPYKEGGVVGGIPGNFASQRMQIFQDTQLIKIPSSMPDEEAAAFPIAAQTVYSIIRRLSLREKENILVTAPTSNTSIAAIEALKQLDVDVFALSSTGNYKDELIGMGVKKIIPALALKDRSVEKYVDNIKFDVIIDPFFDLYFSKIVEYMNMYGRYITCGLYTQHPLFEKSEISGNSEYLSAIAKCIPYNITVIGNCLGEKADLENAITDYINGKYSVVIDSVYSGDDFIPFLEKCFHTKNRFGKVVYKYDDI